MPVIGLVENMAGYACPHCGEVSDPFGRGGAEAEAARLGIPFLGRVPLTIAIRAASDAGEPPAARDDDPVFAPIARQSRRGWHALTLLSVTLNLFRSMAHPLEKGTSEQVAWQYGC